MPSPLGLYTLNGTLNDVSYGGLELTLGAATFGQVKAIDAVLGLTATQGGNGQSTGYQYSAQGTVFGVFDILSDGTIMGQHDGINGVKVSQEGGVLVLKVDQQTFTSSFSAYDQPVRISVGWDDTQTALCLNGVIAALVQAVPTLPAAEFHVLADSSGGNGIAGTICFLAYYSAFLGPRMPLSLTQPQDYDLFAYGQNAIGDEFYATVEALVQGTNLLTDGSSNAYLLSDIGATSAEGKKKFSTPSIDTFGGGLKINTPSASTYTWNAGDYTVEAWVYRTGSVPSQGANTRPTMVGLMNDTTSTHYWSLGIDGTVLEFNYTIGGAVEVIGGITIPQDQWVHVAMVHSASQINLYVNGQVDTSAAVAGTPVFNTSTPLVIGKFNSLNGDLYVDQVRISTMARYTQAFTPESNAFYAFQLTSGIGAADEKFTMEDGLDRFANTGAVTNHTLASYSSPAIFLDDGTGNTFVEIQQNQLPKLTTISGTPAINIASGEFFLSFKCYLPSAISINQYGPILTTSYDGDMIYLYANATAAANQADYKIGVGSYWGERIPSNTQTPLDQWFEVGIQRDQSQGDDIQIFIDGVLIQTWDVTGRTFPEPFYFGFALNVSQYLIGARYDDIRLYPARKIEAGNGYNPASAYLGPGEVYQSEPDPLLVGEGLSYRVSSWQTMTDLNLMPLIGYNPVSDDAAFRAPSSWTFGGPNEAMKASTEVPMTAKLSQDTWVSRDGHIHSNLVRADVRYGSLSYGGSAVNISKARPSGKISGTVVDEFSAPVSRLVKLADRESGNLVSEQWADASGTYQFRDLSTTRLYTVIAHDYTGTYNAVIKDNVTAEVDPNP